MNEHSGRFVDWHLKLWGESIDPAKAKLLPMPTEEDDNDHAEISTTTLAASTTSLAPDPAATETELPTTTATDHPDRPVNAKPTDATSTSSSPSTSSTASAPGTNPTTGSSTWLPSFLPSFGVSGRTQAWIYGALGLIVVFCSGLGAYFWMARRKRLRNTARDDYQFELLDDEEAEGLNSGEKKGSSGAGAGKKGRRTRGGELYDAFAGGSDDEDEEDEFGGAGEEYRDHRADAGGRGMGEKRSSSRGLESDDAGEEDDDEHHVVGDSEDEESGDDRPLRGSR